MIVQYITVTRAHCGRADCAQRLQEIRHARHQRASLVAFGSDDLLGLGQVRTLQHLLQLIGVAAEDDVACTGGTPENLTRDAFAALA